MKTEDKIRIMETLTKGANISIKNIMIEPKDCTVNFGDNAKDSNDASDISADVIQKIADKIKGRHTIHWSHVYYAYHELGIKEFQNAANFASHIHDLVPSIPIETIRKSGDYQRRRNSDEDSIYEVKKMISANID